MKKLGSYLILVASFFSLVVFAAGGIKEFSQDILRFGSSGTGIRKLIFDATPDGASATLSVDPTSDEFSMNNKLNMLSNSFSLGDGNNSDKEIVINNGATNPPKLVYNSTDNAWTFTNDGTLFKKIGSGSGNGSGGINILQNPGFEDGSTRNWIASANIAVSDVTSGADLGIGEKSAKLVASDSGSYCSDVVTKPNALGFGCQVSFKYKGGSTGHHKLVVYDNAATPNKLTEFDIVHSDVWYEINTSAIKSFACADQMKLCIETDQADASSSENIILDEMYLGNNNNFTSIQPSAQFVGSITWQPTASCEWTNTNSSFSDFPSDADCDDNPRIVTGSVEDISNGLIPKFRLKNVKKGHYRIEVTGEFESVGDNSSNGVYRLYDGVNTYNTEYFGIYITITNTMQPRVPVLIFDTDIQNDADFLDISLQSIAKNTSTNVVVKDSNLKFSVYYYPDKGFEAWYPEQSAFYYKGYISGTDKKVTDKTRTFQPVEQSDYVLHNLIGNAFIPCDDAGVDSTGTTCSSGNEDLGIALDIPYTGKYKVCFNSTTLSYSTTTHAEFKIAETENIPSSTNNPSVIQMGREKSHARNNNSSSIANNIQLCSVFDIDKIGKHTFRLLSYNNSDGSIYVYSEDAHGNFDITVEMVQENVHAPFILNQVSTSVKSGVSVESCKILNNGTATLDSDNCTDWVVSATRLSAGIVDITTKDYGSIPVCTVTTHVLNSDNNAQLRAAMTNTYVQVLTQESASSQDRDFHLICIFKR